LIAVLTRGSWLGWLVILSQVEQTNFQEPAEIEISLMSIAALSDEPASFVTIGVGLKFRSRLGESILFSASRAAFNFFGE